MKARVTTKKPGNVLNIRQAMSGKGNAVIVDTIPDQTEIDVQETKNTDWFKVEYEGAKGYIRTELVTLLPTKIKVEEPDGDAADLVSDGNNKDNDDNEADEDEE